MFGRDARVVVVGAGAGGLAAAVDLARAGCDVVVLDAAGAVGGKMRALEVGGARVDVGPTVLTMRWVLERLFSDAGASLSSRVRLTPTPVLARHAWPDGARLDLFADPAASRAAIAETFGEREARGFERFAREGAALYRALERTFIEAERPGWRGLFALARSMDAEGVSSLGLRTLSSALGRHFSDPRLLQLFGRYATYCGSWPMRAPATLAVIAHVESMGVHRVEGGMSALARAMAELAEQRGARVVLRARVAKILHQGAARGVVLESGEEIPANAIVYAGDVSALGALLGRPKPTPRRERSLSAVTIALRGVARGFPLAHHNVFFSPDYAREWTALAQGEMPEAPTVYLCAEDRDHDGAHGEERALLVVNAPPSGDEPGRWTKAEEERWRAATFSSMKRCGLDLDVTASAITTPATFHRWFPDTGGAIYGPITHGPLAALRRWGSTGPIPRLYLTGGSVHPGAGVPMAAISGRLAATRVLSDLASTRTSVRADIDGTTSTA